MTTPSTSAFAEQVISFVLAQKQRTPGAFLASQDGLVSLSASTYAVMTLHYLGALTRHSDAAQQAAWAAYINQWQDEQSGLFYGPEITESQFTLPGQDKTYQASHLTINALSALDLLGAAPRYPLRYAEPFLDAAYLTRWLDAVDFRDAWFEGNRLLITGALLTWLRERAQRPEAVGALDRLFEWLDARQDPHTGLWGTDGACGLYTALYGASHQLVLYFYHNRPLPHAERIVDTILSLQHADGGFAEQGGGGACEDFDAIDILAKLALHGPYRHGDIAQALRRALPALLARQMSDGGFVYRRFEPYSHNGLVANWAGPERGQMFATWFRVLTIGMVSQVVRDQPYAQLDWQFNRICSLGWHRATAAAAAADSGPVAAATVARTSRASLPAKLSRQVLRRAPPSLVEKMLNRYVWSLPADAALRFLLRLNRQVSDLIGKRSYEIGSGLHPAYWHTQYGKAVAHWFAPGATILHVGAGDGTASLSLAAMLGGRVIAVVDDKVEAAARLRDPALLMREMDDRWEDEAATAVLLTSRNLPRILPRLARFVAAQHPHTLVCLDPQTSAGEWAALERQLDGADGTPSAGLTSFLHSLGYRSMERRLHSGEIWTRAVPVS